jgi:hypothetical protein
MPWPIRIASIINRLCLLLLALICWQYRSAMIKAGQYYGNEDILKTSTLAAIGIISFSFFIIMMIQRGNYFKRKNGRNIIWGLSVLSLIVIIYAIGSICTKAGIFDSSLDLFSLLVLVWLVSAITMLIYCLKTIPFGSHID